jgi:hypothetical protein
LDIPCCRWNHTQGHRIGVDDDHRGGWRCVECRGGHGERPRVAGAVEDRVLATDRQRACGQLGDGTSRADFARPAGWSARSDASTAPDTARCRRLNAGREPVDPSRVGRRARIVAVSHPLPRRRSCCAACDGRSPSCDTRWECSPGRWARRSHRSGWAGDRRPSSADFARRRGRRARSDPSAAPDTARCRVGRRTRVVAASHPLPCRRSLRRAVAAVVRGVTVAVLV